MRQTDPPAFDVSHKIPPSVPRDSSTAIGTKEVS